MADNSTPEEWGDELPVTRDANPPMDIKFNPGAKFVEASTPPNRCPRHGTLGSFCDKCEAERKDTAVKKVDEYVEQAALARGNPSLSNIVDGKCTYCKGDAQESTNNPSGKSRLACPTCSPRAFNTISSGRSKKNLDSLVNMELDRRKTAGTCENCGIITTDGECDTHGRNTQRPVAPKFDVSADYAARGTLSPKSTLEDYKHMAWWKGGTTHFQSESCTTGQCTPDTTDHKDRLILHWDARTTNQKNPRHREYQDFPQLRTHRSPGLFRSTTDAEGNVARMDQQS